jgi:hypothetical protein
MTMVKLNIFIDDRITVTPDIGSNRHRAVQAMLLAIHALCCPLDPNEPIPWDDCLLFGKLDEGEGLSECPTILGWVVNTRLLTIVLPGKKFNRWNQDLSMILKWNKVSLAAMESTVGRLNHATMAYPIMHYFLNRSQNISVHWAILNKSKKVERYLPSQVLQDLQLWKNNFLPRIHQGMSMNLISYHRPTVLCWFDACPSGMGGFDHLGNAWCFPNPSTYSCCTETLNNLSGVHGLYNYHMAGYLKRPFGPQRIFPQS